MSTKVRMATDKGTIELELFDADAPKTVENFTKLIKEGYYDGIAFHRVVPDFVIQGGDPYTKDPSKSHLVGSGGPGYTIPCETAGNPHKHGRGYLSMAHAGRNTGGSQFFITHSPQPHLDNRHTVFGKVTSGLEVVDAIEVGDRMTKVEIIEG